MALTPNEEDVASHYRKMLKMGMPEGAVMQKMALSQVPLNIQNAVLAGVDETTNTDITNFGEQKQEQEHDAKDFDSPAPFVDNQIQVPNADATTTTMTTSDDKFVEEEIEEEEFNYHYENTSKKSSSQSNLNASTMSFYEEVIIDDDDDDVVLEEIIDEDIEDSDEFEEEIVEEEYVDYDNRPRQEFEKQTNNDDYKPYRYYEQQVRPNQITSIDGMRQTTDDDQIVSTAAGSELFNRDNVPIHQQRRQDALVMDPTMTSSKYFSYNDVDMIPQSGMGTPVITGGGLGATHDVVGDQRRPGGEGSLNPNAFSKKAIPEKPLPSPSSCWYWFWCIMLLGLIGASVGSGYWLTTRDGNDVSTVLPPNRTRPPTAAPSVGVSTYFDNAVEIEDCNFDDVANPHPMAQCACFGEIVMIEEDIRERHRYNVENFIPIHFQNYEDDISSCSARNQALVWISSGDDIHLNNVQRTQRFALATIFASLGGTQWNKNDNWVSYKDTCKWFGVTCERGFVAELVLDRNNLVGMIPSEMSLLEQLKFLMIAQNKIEGHIPVELFTIQTLGTVDIGFNSITGVIPPTVGDALYLNSLNIENNLMSGRLTKSIGKANNLRFLNLKSNKFVSELPMELFDLEQLIELNIGGNQFVGTIAQDIYKLKLLNRLTLGPNLFTGSLPLTVSSLSNLKYLSATQIKGLDGRIPTGFGLGLTSLEEVIISGTSIEGNIDTSFGMLQRLKILEFSRNQLRSVIPSELGNLNNLVTLNLEQNFLDGRIPEEIGNLSTLQQLKLNNNLLEGGIPISFSNLSSLEIMKLETNRLEDRVEDGICDLRNGQLNEFVVDCPIEIEGMNGIELFGVVCPIPLCCSRCVVQ